jgi:hypothetical protein
MSLYEIRDNNYLQPNRFFSIRGTVKYIEREVKYTKLILLVFSYYNIDGKPDEITVHFKGETKKTVDNIVYVPCSVSVMGDIIIKENKIFFDGKIIEVFKRVDFVTEDNAELVDPNETNYDKAF